MAHYMTFYPGKYLAALDLAGGDVTATITRIGVEEMKAKGGETEQKPILFFDNGHKPIVMNKTNAKVIAGMYGEETNGWIGKPVTLYAAEVEAFGEMVMAIRVRLVVPKAPTAPAKPKGRK